MKFRRANKILFGVGLSLPILGLVAMTWLVHSASGQFSDSFNWVVHSYKVLDAIEQAQTHVVDAEANRRGYLLTGREDYFSPYDAAMASVNDDIDRLKTLTGDNLIQQTNIVELQKAVADRLGLNYEQAIAERTNTPAVVLTQRGRDTVNQLHRILFQMRQSEQQLLTRRQQEAEADALASQVMSFVLIGAVALALIFIVLILVRLEKLQSFITICAWTGQVKEGDEWMRLDEYLKRRFGLSVSHGMSKELAQEMIERMKRSGETTTGPRNQ